MAKYPIVDISVFAPWSDTKPYDTVLTTVDIVYTRPSTYSVTEEVHRYIASAVKAKNLASSVS